MKTADVERWTVQGAPLLPVHSRALTAPRSAAAVADLVLCMKFSCLAASKICSQENPVVATPGVDAKLLNGCGMSHISRRLQKDRSCKQVITNELYGEVHSDSVAVTTNMWPSRRTIALEISGCTVHALNKIDVSLSCVAQHVYARQIHSCSIPPAEQAYVH